MRPTASEYGLQAGVFTQSIDLAMAIADRLHVGAVVINETSDVRIDSMPFGGFKKSGVGREGVKYAVLRDDRTEEHHHQPRRAAPAGSNRAGCQKDMP